MNGAKHDAIDSFWQCGVACAVSVAKGALQNTQGK
jgi:hypothetical protein